MTTIFGIANCDTMKRARGWLADHGVVVEFHDYKKRGIDAAMLAAWADRVGWEKLLNRSGTTFRKLPDDAKVDLDREKALALMVVQPSMIRRPVLVVGDDVVIGFDAAAYAGLFAKP